MPPPFGYVVYRHVLFDESLLAHIMDLQDIIEDLRVKRDKKVEEGETAQALALDARRDKYVIDLARLLTDLKK